MKKNNADIDVAHLRHPHLDEQDYQAMLSGLQLELMQLQLGTYRCGKRVVLLLEGPDAAGKGGLIRRLVRHMDPRGVRVHAIGPPSELERGQHYLQRFWSRLPQAGRWCVFDRSWYGRVLVERVECGLTDWPRAAEEIKYLEKMLIDDGVILIKILLYIDKEEQRQRLLKRLNNPEKAWKLTTADLDSHLLHDQYVAAYNDMLAATHTPVPWHCIPANHKRYARVKAMQTIRDDLHGRVVPPTTPSAEFEQRAQRILQP